MNLTRVQNWNSLLRGYMNEATQKPFEWGVFDCALNACDAVMLITGVDLAEPFRGKYSDEEGAWAVLKEHGFNNTFEYASAKLPKTDALLHAHDGDLAAFEYEGHQIVGLMYGGRIWAPSPGLVGMGSVNLLKAHTLFKVGEA